MVRNNINIIMLVMVMIITLLLHTATAAYNGTLMYLGDGRLIEMNPNTGVTRWVMLYTNVTLDYTYDRNYSIMYFLSTTDGTTTKVDAVNPVTATVIQTIQLEVSLINIQYEAATASLVGCVMKGNSLSIQRVSLINGRAQIIATYDTVGRPPVRGSSGLDDKRRMYMTTIGGIAGQPISIISVNLASGYLTAVPGQTVLEPIVYDISTGGFFFGVGAQQGKILLDVTRGSNTNTVIPSMGGDTYSVSSGGSAYPPTIFASITDAAYKPYIAIYSTAGGWQLNKYPMGVSSPTRFLAYLPNLPYWR